MPIYRSLDGRRLMAVPFDRDPTFVPRPAEILFEGEYLASQQRTYDIAPDGRFLMIKRSEETRSDGEQLVLVQHWDTELAARMAAN